MRVMSSRTTSASCGLQPMVSAVSDLQEAAADLDTALAFWCTRACPSAGTNARSVGRVYIAIITPPSTSCDSVARAVRPGRPFRR